MTGTGARVLIHVQHLLGTGHTRRMAAVARALAAAGARVLLASGGSRIAGLDLGGARLLQLPELCATDASYRELVDAGGRCVDDAWRGARCARLLEAARGFAPDLLLVESFPFARRALAFELLPLLEMAGTRGVPAWSSVRDVLEPKERAERTAEVIERLGRYFSGVLVHGDPALVALEASFPDRARIPVPVYYTGYVMGPARGATRACDAGRTEILVSAGGGAVGADLLECAVRAAATPAGRRWCWRVLVPQAVPAARYRRLRAAACPGVVVERNRVDFPALLARAAVAVSQAGYNTVAETLAAGARAVWVPFAGGGEREQGIRARALAARGLGVVLEAGALAPTALAAAVARSLDAPPAEVRLARDGAAQSAARLLAALAGG